jgi:hypothetical protein
MTMETDKPQQAGSDEDFLQRWSRRKHETQQQADTLPTQDLPDATSEPAPLLTDADMPPIESLTEDSDYSGFLSPNVSEALRRQALRKLFSSASFNIRDGLDDYDDNFTQFEKLGDIITADMKHQLEKEAQRLKEFAEDETETSDDEVQAQVTATANEESDTVSKEVQDEVTDDVEEQRT